MVTTAKEVTWLYRQQGIPVQFNISYKMQLIRFWLSSDKICPRELMSIIYCIAWSSFSLQRAKTSNSQTHRVTERTVCTWVTSKLTYWYIRDVCSVASRAKGYQALPLLTVHSCRAGGGPGNEARMQLVNSYFSVVLCGQPTWNIIYGKLQCTYNCTHHNC